MDRITLDDGRWFDRDKATEYKEARDWNGSNHISRATGSQWHHEDLWKTKSGLWVLEKYSAYQNILTTYEQLTDEEAANWLLRNEHYDAVPEDVLADYEV